LCYTLIVEQKFVKAFISISILSWIVFSPVLAYAGNPPDAAHSSLTATEEPADGSTQSTITITLQDSSGTAISGDTVQLSNSSDSSLKISPSSATLDSSGSATFTAASNNPGTDPITVTDTTTGTTLTNLGQIVFDVPPTPVSQQCSATAPANAPNLYQVVAVKDSATVYFAPPSDSFDGFTISYGLDSNADTYNATFSQGNTGAAVKYTVNSLTPNTKYYFKVRANNGCSNGPWSNVVSTSGQSSLPVTGSMDFAYLGIGAMIMVFGGLRLYTYFK
jgi:hypothetical protein